MTKRLLALAVIGAASIPQRADADEPVAIESYGGQRPDDAAGVVDPLLADLARRGFLTGSNLAARIEQDVSRSGEPFSAVESTWLVGKADAGYRAFQQGQFEEAVKALGAVWAAFVARPSTVAEKQALRDHQIKTLIGLALANHRLGNQEAAIKHMSEFLRSFPDREISRALYGPEPAELAKKVRAELDRQASGTLRVEVLDDPGGVVFINERYVSVGSADVSLYPGAYRVHVRGRLKGRVHDVTVEPGQKNLLQVRLSAEAALNTSEKSPLLGFLNEDDRAASEAASAASIGASLRATEVAVVGIRVVNGRRTLIGALIAAGTGRPIRSGSLVMEPVAPSARQLSALGRFIASGEADPTVPLGAPKEAPQPRQARASARKPWFRDTWGWVLVGSGLALTGTGAGLFVSASGLDTDADEAIDDDSRRELRDKASSRGTLGTVFTVVGIGAVVVGVVKLAWPSRAEAAGQTRIAAGPTWVGLEGAF